nr:hypothetical protein [Tanacetum cinerariifolium]
MSTQQDIYAAGSKSRPPMLNKESYVPWSSCLLWYAKSKPNGKLIHNSILNGPYVRRMIPEPGDANREVTKEVDELKTERFAKTQDPLALIENSNNPYAFPAPHQDQPSFNQNYLQQPMPNPEDITDPTSAMNMALALMAKAFKINYSTPTNNNQRISLNPRNRLIGVLGNGNQNGNANLVVALAKGNATGQNGNQIRCYNCRGVGHYARNCTVRPRRRDAAYLQTQLLITQKEKAGIKIQAEEYDLRATAADLDEIEEVNANCILMANLLNKQLSEEKSTVSFLLEEKKKLKSDFKTHEDKLLDKQIQLEKRIKELNNILVKTGQTIHMLSPKPDSFYHSEQKMALGYQNTFYLKQAQKKQQSLYDGKVLLEKHDPPVVHDSEETLQLA